MKLEDSSWHGPGQMKLINQSAHQTLVMTEQPPKASMIETCKVPEVAVH